MSLPLVTSQPTPLRKPGELLDRVWVSLTHFYTFVGAHPLLRKNKHLQALYDTVDDALNDLYQAVGQLDPKREESDLEG